MQFLHSWFGLGWGYALFAYIFNDYAHALGVMSENFG